MHGCVCDPADGDGGVVVATEKKDRIKKNEKKEKPLRKTLVGKTVFSEKHFCVERVCVRAAMQTRGCNGVQFNCLTKKKFTKKNLKI